MLRELVVAGQSGPSTLTFNGNLVQSISQIWEVPSFVGGQTETRLYEHLRSFEPETGYPEGSAEIIAAADRQDIVVTERSASEPGSTEVETRTETSGFDADGNLVWREVEDFDGTRTFETYSIASDGTTTLRASTSVDPDNAHDWAMQQFFYRSDGILAASYSVQDNGLYERTEYRRTDGSVFSVVAIDFGEVQAGRVIETTYLLSGEASQTQVLADDGIYTRTSYGSPGVITYLSQSDVDDTQDWDEIEETYTDTGVLESKTTIYDDGGEDVYQATFDADGLLEEESAHFADGTSLDRFYTAGQLYLEYFFDAYHSPGVYDWDSFERAFDESGQIRSEFIEYDNGVVESREYAEGVITKKREDDNPYSPQDSAYRWERRVTYYDLDGDVRDISILWDDGRLVENQYEDGQLERSFIQDTDNGFRWESMSRQFDETGQLVAATMRLDDGREFSSSFTDGNRQQMTVTDTADQFEWHSFTDQFDNAGSRVSRVQIGDNGVRSLTEFGEDRTVVTRYDDADAFAWKMISTTTAETDLGTRQITSRTLDTGLTVRTVIGEDGDKLRQSLFDGGDDKDWQIWDMSYYADQSLRKATVTYDDGRVRETYFDRDGSVELVEWTEPNANDLILG